MRQQGGGVVTCAGFPVQMFPATPYAKARMTAIYGSELGGYIRPSQAQTFVPNPPAYQSLTRTSRCDAQGFFKFEKLKDGDFYVIAPVVWVISNVTQGGMLSTLVRVKDGEPKEIVLAH